MATDEKNSTRYAVVTGANKGIGLEICRQLASKGIEVILTARDKQRGLGAVKGLEESGISVIFHQLDVTDAGSIARLAEFIDTSYGRLDILVNNAGVGGAIVDWETFNTMAYENGRIKANAAELLLELTKQTYEVAEECAKVVYFGTKNTTEALLPLLLRSSSGRIVNVSASIGKLQMPSIAITKDQLEMRSRSLSHVKNEKVKRELNDIETLKKERLDEILSEFLRDFKEDKLGAEGWPTHLSAYTVSKAVANAYTRLLAQEHPQLHVNSVCPGFVKTDMNSNNGVFPVEDGARGPVMLALLPDDGPSGCFFAGTEVSGF